MILGITIIAVLCALAGYQFRQNVEVVRRSEAEERLREESQRTAELADKLSKSYGGVTCTVRGQLYKD